jgi:hypothetical protein
MLISYSQSQNISYLITSDSPLPIVKITSDYPLLRSTLLQTTSPIQRIKNKYLK